MTGLMWKFCLGAVVNLGLALLAAHTALTAIDMNNLLQTIQAITP